MALLELLNTSEIAVQIINFLLLLVLLRIFFWRRILKLIDERKARISAEFQQIENSKRELESLKSDYAEKLSSIEEIAREKIQEAMDEGSRRADQLIKKAQLDSQGIIDSARLDITQEISKAKEELKEQIIDLTIKATEEVISQRLTPQDDRRLVEKFLDEVDKAK